MDIKKIVNLLLEELIQSSTPSVVNINNAIDNHEKVIITYNSEGKDKFTGPRAVDIYAYGLTSSGNPVIRAFQEYPHNGKTVKGWKFFRIDRIGSWKNTGQNFYKPKNFGLYGEFNEEGDKTMSTVFNIAKFEGDESDVGLTISPITKQMVQTTQTEKGLKHLKNAVENPIYLKDLKKENGFDGYTPKKETSGPKTISKPYNKMNGKERDEYRAWKEFNAGKSYNVDDLYKMMNQNSNEPEDRLSDKFFNDYEKRQERSQNERDKRALGITGEITPEKLEKAQGAVDRLKKYKKNSANDYINSISDEELKKALEKLKNAGNY